MALLHQRLAASARRCYPTRARRFGLRGQVRVQFTLDAAGLPSSVSLEGTTGSPLLDAAARDCVVQGAAPLPGAGTFTVPILFGELAAEQ